MLFVNFTEKKVKKPCRRRQSTSFLPVHRQPQVLPVPEYERDPLVIVGQADVTRQVDAGVGQGHHGRHRGAVAARLLADGGEGGGRRRRGRRRRGRQICRGKKSKSIKMQFKKKTNHFLAQLCRKGKSGRETAKKKGDGSSKIHRRHSRN